MTTIAEYKVKLPTWALSYLVNGEDSGITDEDKGIVDLWYQAYMDEADAVNGHVILGSVDPDQEAYFDWNPAFGEACEVENYLVLIVK